MSKYPPVSHRFLALSLAAVMAVSPVCATQTDTLPLPEEETTAVQSLLSDSVPLWGDFTKRGQYLRYSPKLREKGYSQGELDLIFSRLPTNRVMMLLRYDYTPMAAQCAAQPHFQSGTLERCLRYARERTDLTAWDVVTQINMGLDYDHYSFTRRAFGQGDYDVLVNKYNSLSSSYIPELTPMDSRYASYAAFLEPTAYEWFTQMVDAAQADGIWLYCVSAYRSYNYQKDLYDRYVAQNGKNRADTFSARPGHSEHQTGLAVDINVASSSAHFENTKQYRWLTEHCWEYGFILRYPEGAQHLTGFKFEPWHYRYVGRELALAIRDSGLTYDEYIAALPTGNAPQATALLVDGTRRELERAAVTLDKTHYLALDDLADALDLPYTLSPDGIAHLYSPALALTLKQDELSARLNSQEHQMAVPPIVQDGQLLLPLEDLAPLLGFTVTQEGETLILTADTPEVFEELPPLQQETI